MSIKAITYRGVRIHTFYLDEQKGYYSLCNMPPGVTFRSESFPHKDGMRESIRIVKEHIDTQVDAALESLHAVRWAKRELKRENAPDWGKWHLANRKAPYEHGGGSTFTLCSIVICVGGYSGLPEIDEPERVTNASYNYSVCSKCRRRAETMKGKGKSENEGDEQSSGDKGNREASGEDNTDKNGSETGGKCHGDAFP